jgi:signal transduction histidine kinase
MRSGVLAAALLFTALGLVLTFTPRRGWPTSAIALLAGIGAAGVLPYPRNWLEGAFLGCWISVSATGAMVHLGPRLAPLATAAISLNAGFWATTASAASGSKLEVLGALPCVLIILPAAWLNARFGPLPIKVVSSWVIVIAVLAATLQMLPVTPGYLPDHLE